MSRPILTIAGLMLLLCLPAMVKPYTLVFRDGRRLEISDNFVVNNATLTYEVGPGIQITLRLEALDIPATERTNKEQAGSLRKHLPTKRVQISEQRVVPSGITVTNVDLERFRNARVAAESADEKRRKELGLPSADESRQALLAVGERAQEKLRAIQSEEQKAETYWRSRAAELRAELAAINERINFVQARLNELPLNYSFGAFTTISPFAPIGQFGHLRTFGTVIGNPIGFGRVHRFGRIGFGNGRIHGRVGLNPFPRRGFAGRRFANPFPFGAVIAIPFDTYDNSYERSALLSELDQLFAQRAGLQARWRSLEEEARRSGAYPGWLR